jgi:NADH:ubiquinone oxidoreductase subunit 5 (subunit L)/multisubunit Na+/H+ antiporter MnhA subunit
MLALATVGIPVIGSFITLAADRVSATLRNTLAVLILLATFLSCLALAPLAGQAATTSFGTFVLPGLNIAFVVDGLGVYVAATSSLIGLLILLYSLGYMKEYAHQGEYYFFVVLFLGAMMGLVLSANLLLIYVFWEITAICSWRLIGFYREPQHLRSADTALLLTVFGSFCMLLGLEMIWQQTGTFALDALHGKTIGDATVALLMLGMLAKSAQIPLQIWLPAAGIAPSPVTALLHAAVLVVIGVFAFARIFVGVFGLTPTWQATAGAFAIATILVAGAAALVENNAKRILAYSTLGQLGYVFLGLASMNVIGIVGALVFLLAHSLAKAGLFLCIGIVEHRTHTRDIRELGGLIRTMPVTAITFVLCALTIVGLPPTAGFFGKMMIIMGAAQGGNIVFPLLAVLGAFLSLVYMVRLFNAVFLGEERWPQIREGTPIMVATVIGFAALALLVGFAITPLSTLVNALVAQLFIG